LFCANIGWIWTYHGYWTSPDPPSPNTPLNNHNKGLELPSFPWQSGQCGKGSLEQGFTNGPVLPHKWQTDNQ
jgi:hypothetical protein